MLVLPVPAPSDVVDRRSRDAEAFGEHGGGGAWGAFLWASNGSLDVQATNLGYLLIGELGAGIAGPWRPSRPALSDSISDVRGVIAEEQMTRPYAVSNVAMMQDMATGLDGLARGDLPRDAMRQCCYASNLDSSVAIGVTHGCP